MEYGGVVANLDAAAEALENGARQAPSLIERQVLKRAAQEVRTALATVERARRMREQQAADRLDVGATLIVDIDLEPRKGPNDITAALLAEALRRDAEQEGEGES